MIISRAQFAKLGTAGDDLRAARWPAQHATPSETYVPGICRNEAWLGPAWALLLPVHGSYVPLGDEGLDAVRRKSSLMLSCRTTKSSPPPCRSQWRYHPVSALFAARSEGACSRSVPPPTSVPLVVTSHARCDLLSKADGVRIFLRVQSAGRERMSLGPRPTPLSAARPGHGLSHRERVCRACARWGNRTSPDQESTQAKIGRQLAMPAASPPVQVAALGMAAIVWVDGQVPSSSKTRVHHRIRIPRILRRLETRGTVRDAAWVGPFGD